MNFLKKHKNKIIIAAYVIALLVIVFIWGGNAPSSRGLDGIDRTSGITFSSKKHSDVSDAYGNKDSDTPPPSASPEQSAAPTKAAATPKPTAVSKNTDKSSEEGDIAYSEANGMDIDEETGMDEYLTEPVPEGRPVPQDEQNVVVTDTALKCTLAVRCDTILDNMSWLDSAKRSLVPSDGVIFAEREVIFYDGESVFNLLAREMRQNGIHMEFASTPMFNSTYIEGINNIYEYDCGELSGWMYRVNGWFPNYGCSRYELKPGDRVEWIYTCDLGADIGGEYAAQKGQ